MAGAPPDSDGGEGVTWPRLVPLRACLRAGSGRAEEA